MNKLLKRLLVFDTFEFKTKLPKEKVLEKVHAFKDSECGKHYVKTKDNGFIIIQYALQRDGYIKSQNSLVPVIRASVEEKDGITVINGLCRPTIPVIILLAIPYLLTSFAIFPLLLWQLIFTLVFFNPLKRILEELEYLLVY